MHVASRTNDGSERVRSKMGLCMGACSWLDVGELELVSQLRNSHLCVARSSNNVLPRVSRNSIWKGKHGFRFEVDLTRRFNRKLKCQYTQIRLLSPAGFFVYRRIPLAPKRFPSSRASRKQSKRHTRECKCHHEGRLWRTRRALSRHLRTHCARAPRVYSILPPPPPLMRPPQSTKRRNVTRVD